MSERDMRDSAGHVEIAVALLQNDVQRLASVVDEMRADIKPMVRAWDVKEKQIEGIHTRMISVEKDLSEAVDTVSKLERKGIAAAAFAAGLGGAAGGVAAWFSKLFGIGG